MRMWCLAVLVAAGCATEDATDIVIGDSLVDSDVIDTDGTDLPVEGETDESDLPAIDTAETDLPEDTDPVLTSYTITGRALCVDGVDDVGTVIHGDPANPRTVRVLPGPGMYCRPLGGGCSTTVYFDLPLVETEPDVDGNFELTFETTTLDELYLFSETTARGMVGNCGSGHQFTEITLVDLEASQGFTDIMLDVYSIFF
jgi:hypothetical protein